VHSKKWPFFKSISTIRRSFYELQICSRGALSNFRPILLFNLLQWPIIRHISCVGPLYKKAVSFFAEPRIFVHCVYKIKNLTFVHIHKQKDTTSHRQSIYICTLNLLVEEYTKSLTINVDRMRIYSNGLGQCSLLVLAFDGILNESRELLSLQPCN